MTNVVHNTFHIRSIDKGTLHTQHLFSRYRQQHVASSYQSVCTWRIQNSTGINHCRHFKGNAAREIALDSSRHDFRVRTLRRQNHVDADSTRFGGNPGNRSLYLFSASRYQICKLINDGNYIR